MKFPLMLCIVFIIVCSCGEKPAAKIDSTNFELVQLAEGVYGCIHKFGGKAICNVGVVDNGKETIVFDSFLSPEVAKELLVIISDLGLSPVKYVVNSHFHNDHIRGNQVFAEQVKIISTLQTKEIIEENEPLQIEFEKENAPARYSHYDSLYSSFNGDKKSREYQQILMWRPYYQTLSNSHLEVKTRVPEMFVDSTLNLNGPLRKVQLITKGTGHTESDLVMYLPDVGILFTGDLVFNNRHPYLGHGNISKWKEWLGFINTLKVTKILPGHGNPGNLDLVNNIKSYIEDIEKKAKKLAVENISEEGLDSIKIPNKYKDWWFDRFYTPNLKFAYESVTTANTN